MKIDRINNSTKLHFGTKVIIAPTVFNVFPSNELRVFKNQIKTLANNGKNDTLLLYRVSPSNIGAEVYWTDGGRLINTQYRVEAPFHQYANYTSGKKNRRGKNINLIDLYNRAVAAIYPHQINDKRYGLKIDKWQDHIPGIKE